MLGTTYNGVRWINFYLLVMELPLRNPETSPCGEGHVNTCALEFPPKWAAPSSRRRSPTRAGSIAPTSPRHAPHRSRIWPSLSIFQQRRQDGASPGWGYFTRRTGVGQIGGKRCGVGARGNGRYVMVDEMSSTPWTRHVWGLHRSVSCT